MATEEARINRTAWHFWVISGVALVWNAMGAMDYVMTQTRNESYMNAFTPEQLEFFYSFPSWAIAALALLLYAYTMQKRGILV